MTEITEVSIMPVVALRIDSVTGELRVSNTRQTPLTKVYIELTRMKTSLSSKAFCSITDRQTNKIFTE